MDSGDQTRILSSLEQPPRRDGSETIRSLEEGVDPDLPASSGMEVSLGTNSRTEVSL